MYPNIIGIFNGNVLSVYLYICFYYCLGRRTYIKLTYEQIRNGTQLTHGLPISRGTLSKAISELKKLKLLEVKRKRYKDPYGERGGKKGKITSHWYKPFIPGVAEGHVMEFPLVSETGKSPVENLDPGGRVQSKNSTEVQSKNSTDNSVQILTESPVENLDPLYCSLNNTTLPENPEKKTIHKLRPKKKTTKSKLPEVTLKHRSSSQSNKLPLISSSDKNEVPSIDIYQEAVTLLWDTIASHNLLSRKSSPTSWKHTFKYYHTTKNINWNELLAVLKWYCNNYDIVIADKYFPQAYSAEGFCEKYPRIVMAIKRREDQSLNIDALETAYDPAPTRPEEITEEEKTRRKILHNASIAHLL
jgi:hypothetical protein